MPDSSDLTIAVLSDVRIPANCAYTSQHPTPQPAQTTGAPATIGLGIPNGGLQVVNPSRATYDIIVSQLATSATCEYEFADQSLLSDVFCGRWVPLPYIYNALKTLRWEGIHDSIWRDERVKNVHYILNPKPWDEDDPRPGDPTHEWWREVNGGRLEEERARGIGQ